MKLDSYIEKCKIDKRTKRKILYELSFRYKKPVRQYRISDGIEYMICPSCKSNIDVDYISFCTICGQKLSWYGSVKYRSKIR